MKYMNYFHSSYLVTFLILTFVFATFINGQNISQWDNVPEFIKKTKSFKRHEDFYRKRALPGDEYPAKRFDEAIKNEIALELHSRKNISSQNYQPWVNIGPLSITYTYPAGWGACSGRIRGLVVHPTNANIVYIGPASGGLWKTTDGGNSWREISNTTFSAITFGAITLDPNNPNIIYAGTGESRYGFNSTSFNGDGLYKSTDGGDTWIRITTLGTSTHFAAIKVAPGNSNILLAALAQGYWKSAYPASAGIWKSSDAGLNWTKVIDVYNGFDVAFDQVTPNKAYAACGGADMGAGFYISTDNGSTFEYSSSGMPTSSQIARMQIAQSLSTPSKIYALVYRGDEVTPQTELYVSENSGSVWTQIAPGKQFAGTYDGNEYSDQGGYDLCIAVSPVNDNKLLIGNVELIGSTDAVNFNYIRYGSENAWNSACHVDYHVIVFAPSDPQIVYLGCDGGIYKSTDGGLTWQHKNYGISTIQFYRFASHPTNKNILHGGAQDNGNFITNDMGSTNWVTTQTGDGMETFYSITGDTLFSSTQNGGLSRRIGNGDFYSIRPEWVGKKTVWTAPFFRHPSISSTIYTANDYFWRSTDAGDTWLKSASPVSSARALNTVAQSPVNPNKLIAAASLYTNTPELYESNDEGSTWSSVAENLPQPTVWIERVKFHPTQENTVFAVLSGFSNARVLRSTNLGTEWTDISGNLPQVPCNDIFIDPLNTNKIFVANDFGVYYSEDSGINYQRLSEGMPFVPVISFDYFASNGLRLLRAGTHGRGIYQISLDPGASSGVAVSGAVNYSNSSRVPLANLRVCLVKQDIVVDSVITNASGSFQFNSVPAGSYNFILKEFPAAGGVNSTDALVIRRYLTGLTTFDSLQIKAADVNGSKTINSTDALLIRRKIASVDTAFKAGDWVYENPDINVNGVNIVQNILVLCTGDVNGSFNPAAVTNKSTGHLRAPKKNKIINSTKYSFK